MNKILFEGFYNTQVRNCQLVATIIIVSSKSGTNSNLQVIILFGILVKTNGMHSKTLLINIYTKIWFSEKI